MWISGHAGAHNPADPDGFSQQSLNPTGSYITRSDFEAFLIGLPEHVIVVLDEAYIEFARARIA
jgi:aspartate/tyrosine/aromatic aminotransferase